MNEPLALFAIHPRAKSEEFRYLVKDPAKNWAVVASGLTAAEARVFADEYHASPERLGRS